MKHPNKPFGCVLWGDAYHSGDEVPEGEMSHWPMLFQIYGWLVRSDATGVTVASEWRPSDGFYRDRSFIPRAMVVEELVLSLSKKAKRRGRTPADLPSNVGGTVGDLSTSNSKPPQ